ncbi:ORF40 [Fowl aviadenovirus 10]|uniref:ORF40 n=2 Tax=Fowl aviadenovirus C TaxID=190063 RepID=A0A7G3VXA1_ADEGX|nr:ORF40 [Fowl aviadenovirus 10]QGQ62448.1 ORF40 [Fowl aviadenovirus C]
MQASTMFSFGLAAASAAASSSSSSTRGTSSIGSGAASRSSISTPGSRWVQWKCTRGRKGPRVQSMGSQVQAAAVATRLARCAN